MQNMPLIFENYNTQTLPCTASQSNALASLCKLCNIILNCAWGPWLVQTPCSLTQSLCASSGASQLILIASQYRATSPGVCRILWFFSYQRQQRCCIPAWSANKRSKAESVSDQAVAAVWNHYYGWPNLWLNVIQCNSNIFKIIRLQVRLVLVARKFVSWHSQKKLDA
jgi:hypothetical protein